MAREREVPVRIIIRKKKGGHGHHGGAWKVALADFMTAMFALFLVLWLVNQSSDVKAAVAGYFFYLARRVSGGLVVPAILHGLWDFSLVSGSVVPDSSAVPAPSTANPWTSSRSRASATSIRPRVALTRPVTMAR